MSQTEDVKRYYGEVIQSTSDLKTGVCCTAESVPAHVREVLGKVHPEVLDRFYGCGSPIPLALDGLTVLDLGCGTGRDAYALSALVGESGRVIGVDMTPAQLEIARRHRDYHAEAFGHSAPNTEFLEGYMEDLAALGIEDGSVDLVVSNCVLNLAADKRAVFEEIFRVLSPGGELYFSDVFADRRIPRELAEDPVLRGECLGGALYTEDFRRLLYDLGCADYRVVSSAPISLGNPKIEAKMGNTGFTSSTVRAFKLDLEDRCEDYGEAVRYLGTIPEAPHAFELDDHHLFETGRWASVCSNTSDMLKKTRFAAHFELAGDRSRHFGLFDCAPPRPLDRPDPGAGCC